MNPDDPDGLLAAGFTPAEIRSLVEALKFGVIAAEETGRGFKVEPSGVEWTPAKRTAIDAMIRRIRAKDAEA